MEPLKYDKPDGMKFHDDFHEHRHPIHEKPVNDLAFRLEEEIHNRISDDKKLHSIIHTVYDKLDDIEKFKLKDLERKIYDAWREMPDLGSLVTKEMLYKIFDRHYTKEEVNAVFGTSSLTQDDIMHKAYEKLGNFMK